MMRWTCGLALLVSGHAIAADQVVSNCSNDAELRSKLATMQATDGGTLTFACGPGPTSIVLTGGTLPTITSFTTVDGGGTVSLSGNNTVRHFLVSFTAALTVRRLTLERGLTTTSGGSILAIGGLAVDRCTFSDNVAGEDGGAIYSTGITIDNSEFLRNRAPQGGALRLQFGGSGIRDSRFIGNQATGNMGPGSGGGILVDAGGQATIERTTFIGNTASFGTAVYLATGTSGTINGIVVMDDLGFNSSISSGGPLNLSNSFLRGRIGAGLSIGVNVFQTQATLTNVTITGYAAAAFTNAAVLTLNSCTLANNTDTVSNGPSSNVYFNRSILAGTTQSNCAACPAPGCHSEGFNFSDDTGCTQVLTMLTDRNNVDPKLEPLGDLGATHGFLPMVDSPVVNAASVTGCPATDQRGLPRPVGAGCDSGAIERQVFEAGPALFEDGFE